MVTFRGGRFLAKKFELLGAIEIQNTMHYPSNITRNEKLSNIYTTFTIPLRKKRLKKAPLKISIILKEIAHVMSFQKFNFLLQQSSTRLFYLFNSTFRLDFYTLLYKLINIISIENFPLGFKVEVPGVKKESIAPTHSSFQYTLTKHISIPIVSESLPFLIFFHRKKNKMYKHPSQFQSHVVMVLISSENMKLQRKKIFQESAEIQTKFNSFSTICYSVLNFK